jgi:hypothetical protein
LQFDKNDRLYFKIKFDGSKNKSTNLFGICTLKNEETKSSENEINESWGQFYDDQFLKKSMVQSFDEFIEVNDDVTDQENMTIEMFIEICNSFPCKKIDITYKINDNVSANV